jgi:exosortase D (VPLPA-CTERM-specific)
MHAMEQTMPRVGAAGGEQQVWRERVLTWGLLALAIGVTLFVFWPGVDNMMAKWETPEYSHGYLIPLVAGFLVWQRKDELERLALPAAWSGLGVVLVGLFLFLAGELATLYVVTQYAFLVVLVGIALATVGWAGVKKLWAPLLILFFMVPLPNFLYNNLSAQLQLISSEWGTAIIRALGISVHLEGNVIDLGEMKLQVVEACNGLRYLFPLITVGFIVAYFYQGALWKRGLVFLSAVPITVIMNSLRIAVTGILVDNYGTAHAEGFLHDFEGWVVFMAAFGMMLGLMWLLTLIGRERRPFREVFGLTLPEPTPEGAEVRRRPVPTPLIASTVVLAAAAVGAQALPERSEIVPPRAEFIDFPVKVGEWQGRRDTMEDMFVEALKFTDYVMVDYTRGRDELVNFYVAYYESQRKGESAHSPKSCLPGGGWEMRTFEQVEVPGATVAGEPVRANRSLIQLGDYRQLVYYWFQQRGRVITNEYLVKLYLFWDALTKNRSDGSLVRLVTPVPVDQDIARADERLQAFTRAIVPVLEAYVPN